MSDNQTAAEERLALTKRKQAAEESRANRQKVLDASTPSEDDDVLDTLLEKLRNGDTVGRRARRARPSADNRPAGPLTLNLNGSTPVGDTADIARDMLARLQSDGFEAFTPASPTVAVAQRRRRRRAETASGDIESPTSPLSSEITNDISSDGTSTEETAETP
jgi:cytokinesis protein